ncbi:predicted protein [Sclerotinia sclerotiorum 1980 UF-70]|uniref:Uncharacterized protein n=1 Tax=Sclerotinia sclerotiorum (strain ATCC 18683 / 1980 / Ss-1) TaxID=665079 RepID=A7EQ24_SCLS1|nr:predicted protein [Sclerotinia sclerotiorum 1980 UF-70]EDO04940.1 predicted protein [Sclerotinia sclerotiorum 1980 UF-70]
MCNSDQTEAMEKKPQCAVLFLILGKALSRLGRSVVGTDSYFA